MPVCASVMELSVKLPAKSPPRMSMPLPTARSTTLSETSRLVPSTIMMALRPANSMVLPTICPFGLSTRTMPFRSIRPSSLPLMLTYEADVTRMPSPAEDVDAVAREDGVAGSVEGKRGLDGPLDLVVCDRRVDAVQNRDSPAAGQEMTLPCTAALVASATRMPSALTVPIWLSEIVLLVPSRTEIPLPLSGSPAWPLTDSIQLPRMAELRRGPRRFRFPRPGRSGFRPA